MDRVWVVVLVGAAVASVWLLPGVPTQTAVGLGLIVAVTSKAGVWLVRHERAVRRIRTRAA